MGNDIIHVQPIEQWAFEAILENYPSCDRMLLIHAFFHAPSNYTDELYDPDIKGIPKNTTFNQYIEMGNKYANELLNDYEIYAKNMLLESSFEKDEEKENFVLSETYRSKYFKPMLNKCLDENGNFIESELCQFGSVSADLSNIIRKMYCGSTCI